MQDILQLARVAITSKTGFSLDKLIVKLKQLMPDKGMPGFVNLLVGLIDERLCMAICNGEMCHMRDTCLPITSLSSA